MVLEAFRIGYNWIKIKIAHFECSEFGPLKKSLNPKGFSHIYCRKSGPFGRVRTPNVKIFLRRKSPDLWRKSPDPESLSCFAQGKSGLWRKSLHLEVNVQLQSPDHIKKVHTLTAGWLSLYVVFYFYFDSDCF